MKKIIALLLVLTMAAACAACASTGNVSNDTTPDTDAPETTVPETTAAPETTAPADDEDTCMSYADYIAADLDTAVVVEFYVQATQSWWDDHIVVYGQDADGAYFAYNMTCSEEDSAKLVAGTKIRVSGWKSEYAGEVEIIDSTFEIIEGDTWIAEAQDLTSLLGTDEMIDHQNELAAFSAMTVEAIEYKNGEPGDDIYVTLSLDGVSYEFCVEVYLTGTDSDVYTTVGTLAAGDIVNVECFLYWYNGMNPHITAISLVG